MQLVIRQSNAIVFYCYRVQYYTLLSQSKCRYFYVLAIISNKSKLFIFFEYVSFARARWSAVQLNFQGVIKKPFQKCVFSFLYYSFFFSVKYSAIIFLYFVMFWNVNLLDFKYAILRYAILCVPWLSRCVIVSMIT